MLSEGHMTLEISNHNNVTTMNLNFKHSNSHYIHLNSATTLNCLLPEVPKTLQGFQGSSI